MTTSTCGIVEKVGLSTGESKIWIGLACMCLLNNMEIQANGSNFFIPINVVIIFIFLLYSKLMHPGILHNVPNQLSYSWRQFLWSICWIMRPGWAFKISSFLVVFSWSPFLFCSTFSQFSIICGTLQCKPQWHPWGKVFQLGLMAP